METNVPLGSLQNVYSRQKSSWSQFMPTRVTCSKYPILASTKCTHFKPNVEPCAGGELIMDT